MRVPTLVPIGQHKIKVRYVTRLSDDDFGEWDPETFTVSISRSKHTDATKVWHTVWHELSHAALELSGWGKMLTEKQEEAVVTALEYALVPLMTFKANAAGVHWREVRFPFEAA